MPVEVGRQPFDCPPIMITVVLHSCRVPPVCLMSPALTTMIALLVVWAFEQEVPLRLPAVCTLNLLPLPSEIASFVGSPKTYTWSALGSATPTASFGGFTEPAKTTVLPRIGAVPT